MGLSYSAFHRSDKPVDQYQSASCQDAAAVIQLHATGVAVELAIHERIEEHQHSGGKQPSCYHCGLSVISHRWLPLGLTIYSQQRVKTEQGNQWSSNIVQHYVHFGWQCQLATVQEIGWEGHS